MEPEMIGARLEQLRMGRGWTLRKLAAEINAAGGGVVSFSYLAELEKGRKSVPSLRTLSRIAAAYGLTVCALLECCGGDDEAVG